MSRGEWTIQLTKIAFGIYFIVITYLIWQKI